MDIPGQTFLITGGGSGLGAATATRLVAEGANVIIADINQRAAAALAAKLGTGAINIPANVVDEHEIQAAITVATEQFGRLDGAINCAGTAIATKTLGHRGPHPLEDFTRVLQVNLIGTFNVARLAAAAMLANPLDGNDKVTGENNREISGADQTERGIIINTASIAAYEAQQGQVAYAASKGGIVSMTLPMARDLAEYGIRVVTIAPGVFETPLMSGVPEPIRARLQSEIPFPGRFGRPEEYAALVVHCIENPMLNGTVIRLDGALRMPAK